MSTQDAKLKVVIDAVDNATATLKNTQRELDGLSSGASRVGASVSGSSALVQSAIGALGAYAGAQGLAGIMNDYLDSAKELSQARFILAGNVKDIESSFQALSSFGDEMQHSLGVGGEYATVIASKMVPRFHDLNKSMGYAKELLRAQKYGGLDAASAAMIFTRASEGQEKALAQLLNTYGLAIPAGASMETIFARLKEKSDEAEKAFPKFAAQLDILKESFGDFKENAGAPIVGALATLLSGVNSLISEFPVLGTVAAAAILTISTALTGLGVASAVGGIAKLLGLSVSFGPWGLAIGAAIGIALMWLSNFNDAAQVAQENMLTWGTALMSTFGLLGAGGMAMATVFTGALAAIGTAIAGFGLILSTTFAGLTVYMLMSIEGYEKSWGGFMVFMSDTLNGLGILMKENFPNFFNFITSEMEIFIGVFTGQWAVVKDGIIGVWDAIAAKIKSYISGILSDIQSVVSWAQQAIDRISQMFSMSSKGGGPSTGKSGARASGGLVSAASAYLVGERGPELFMPSSGGTIIPNAALSSPGGGGYTFNISVNAAAMTDDSAMRRLASIVGGQIVKDFQRAHLMGY